MEQPVKIERLRPRVLAAVRRVALTRAVPNVFGAALDRVWAFLAEHKGLHVDGHNVFLYHHLDRQDEAMPIDFGVEVVRRFEPQGEVQCVETPAGEAATLVHRGPYSGLPRAHASLHAWCAARGRALGAYSLEVYGDWSNDPNHLETTIQYLLR